MPEELKEALARVAATLPAVDWLPPDRLRAKARATRRRTTALVVVLLALAGLGVGQSLRPRPVPALGCPDGQVVVHLKLPAAKAITVLLNSDGTDGTSTARADLRDRGFRVDPGVDRTATGVAMIRYGPKAVGAAWVVRSYLRDEAEYSYDPTRADATVELTLGPEFRSISTAADANRYLASIGHPPLPPGTCAVD